MTEQVFIGRITATLQTVYPNVTHLNLFLFYPFMLRFGFSVFVASFPSGKTDYLFVCCFFLIAKPIYRAIIYCLIFINEHKNAK